MNLTEPTNDPEILKTYNNVCYEICPQCFRSLCISQIHQSWLCRCGHQRVDHIHEIDYYSGPPGHRHPHSCLIIGCDCHALVYRVASDFFTDEDAIAGLREVIADLE